jgi:hypothetical protein
MALIWGQEEDEDQKVMGLEYDSICNWMNLVGVWRKGGRKTS